MKKLSLPLAIFIILISLTTAMFINRSGKAEEPSVCPAGSYDMGDGYCKLEPTGCPYGDSIPMEDCDKFAPPQSEKDQTPPDPDRDYYDAEGTRHTYDGKVANPSPSCTAQ